MTVTEDNAYQVWRQVYKTIGDMVGDLKPDHEVMAYSLFAALERGAKRAIDEAIRSELSHAEAANLISHQVNRECALFMASKSPADFDEDEFTRKFMKVPIDTPVRMAGRLDTDMAPHELRQALRTLAINQSRRKR